MMFSLAYIGPGAGFAVTSSLLVLTGAFLLALFTIAAWPARALYHRIVQKRPPKPARCRRVIVMGLDGMDPGVLTKLMDDGTCPNFAKLRDDGIFQPLETTCPALSPVAWSSFQTGVNPGKHGIYDFLNRRYHSDYSLELSAAKVSRTRSGRSSYQLLRRSQPFWKRLGEYGVFSHIIRVPITFPAEKFWGLCLSGMGIPDLRGTQSMSTLFTTDTSREGERISHIRFEGNSAQAQLLGPPAANGKHRTLPLVLTRNGSTVELKFSGKQLTLTEGVYSNWVQVSFREKGRRKANGICRFLLVQTTPHIEVYVTPVNLNPEKPSLPISHPPHYSVYLAKRNGPFATLGLAEDTSAMEEELISPEAFLEQSKDIQEEREKQFFTTLKKLRRGCAVTVFDETDRVQHMFLGKPPETDREKASGIPNEIRDLYARMDAFLEKTRARLDEKNDVLMVISDHGFTKFSKGVNLNTWLREQGYLEPDANHADTRYLQNISWNKTQAYAFGLTGIYLNLQGREKHGTVPTDQAVALENKLKEELLKLTDPDTGEPVIKNVYAARDLYNGPYREQAPDLVIGYNRGYRASWNGTLGGSTEPVLTPNDKPWAADHCVDPSLVPGVFLCTRKPVQQDRVRLMDIGPTILDLFGIPAPGYMDGKPYELGDPS